MNLRKSGEGVLFLAALALASCVSITEGAGRILDGSAFAEKKAGAAASVSQYTSVTPIIKKNGEKALVIQNKRLPAIKLYGGMPGDGGRFSITGARLLSASYGGWNEVFYDVYAEGVYTPLEDAKSASIKLGTYIETVNIRAGAVRRGATRLEGERALVELRRREERIDALVAWMKKEGGEFTLKAEEGNLRTREKFDAYWKPVLLPEISPAKNRPDMYKNLINENKGGIKYEWGEDVFWNADYTSLIFPEYMRRFRDSGALWRDWDEALDWIYLKYIWDELPEILGMR
ncbi:MAG: hypothetical protein LBG72_07365 [Spirochaetaceae bacterium]|jgi:hypothetical protein|nr:hypothetical protein [Spirochaetaceae bacterium]